MKQGPSLIAAALAITLLRATPVADANEKRTLYNFQGQPDGDNPYAFVIIDEKGDLYGTTKFGGKGGGAYGWGTIFKVHKGRTKILHSFTDLEQPTTGLVRDSAGNLYGSYGTSGYSGGAVFKMSADRTYSVVHVFNGGADGSGEVSDLIIDADDNLYGTTDGGGGGPCDNGCGTVFKVTPDGQETVLYSFKGGHHDGAQPKNWGGMAIDAEGNLYGTTRLGGTLGRGTVFKVTPDGQGTLVASMGGVGGEFPFAGLAIDQAGNLFGISSSPVLPKIFKVTPGGVISVFYSPSFPYPTYESLTVDQEGNLYGTTSNQGNVFKLTPDATYTLLYTFQGGSDGDTTNSRLMMDAKGDLYGTTTFGGTAGHGTVYKIFNDVTN